MYANQVWHVEQLGRGMAVRGDNVRVGATVQRWRLVRACCNSRAATTLWSLSNFWVTHQRRIRQSRTCHLHFILSLANSRHFEMTDGCIKLTSFAIGFIQKWHLKWQSYYRIRHLKWQQFDREIARHFDVISNDRIFWQAQNDRLKMKWRWQVLDCRMHPWTHLFNL